MATYWADPALGVAPEGLRAHRETARPDADVVLLRWPERADPRQAWVACVPDGQSFAEPLGAGADAIATPACPLAERIGEAIARRERRVLGAAHAALVRLASDPMEVADPDDVLRDVNPAWERHTGIPRPHALGLTPAQLLRSDAHPSSFFEEIEATLRAGDVWRGTMVSALPDGGHAFQRASVQRVLERGAPIAGVAVRRVAGSGAMEPGESDVVARIEGACEPMLVLDQAARVVAINAAALALLGQTRRERIGRGFAPLELGAPVDELLPAPGSSLRRDTTLVTARGPRDVEIRAHGTMGGLHRYVVWIVRDVARRKRIERELVEAREAAEAGSRAKSRFLANMSHELRTPLNIILGYAELIAEDVADPDVRRDLERIRDAGNHLLALVGDVLDLARIESGRAELTPEPLDLGALIDEVADEVRPIVEARANRLEVETTRCDVELDRRRMRQVLLNLIGNASKFTEDGVIRLRLRVGSDEIAIDVEDEGIGMTPDEASRVFQSFTQANDRIREQHGGTGLGLTISRSLIVQMGGRIDLSSAKGRGTRFTVVLPRRPTGDRD